MGGAVAGTQPYELSQAGVQSAAPRVAETVRGSGATGVFTTAGVNADLPILATALNEAGITPQQARMLATVPLGPAAADADHAELAAWTVVANVLLNLDETLAKR